MTAGVAAVVSFLAERDPSLEIVGSGVEATLRRRAQPQPPQQPDVARQEKPPPKDNAYTRRSDRKLDVLERE